MWHIRPPEQLGHLTDVDTTTTAPTDGQALVFDDVSGLWVPGDVAAGGAGAYAETIGDGTETEFVVTHDLGTTDVVVQLWDLTGTDPTLATDDADSIEATDVDTVTVTFSAAPATDAYRVVVLASGSSDGGGGTGTAGSRVHKSNTTHTTNTAVQWTDVDYDDLGIVDLGTSTTQFTIADAGLYTITFSVLLTNADSISYIIIDGGRHAFVRYASSGTIKGQNLTWTGNLDVGQVVSTEAGALNQAGPEFLHERLTWLAITKLA